MKIYVMPAEDGGWAVKLENKEEIESVHEEKRSAIEEAKELALGRDAELIILKRDGTIDNLDAYSTDPFPSEDLGPEFNDSGDEGV